METKNVVTGIVFGIISLFLVEWLVFDFIPTTSAPDWAKASISFSLIVADVIYWAGLVISITKQ